MPNFLIIRGDKVINAIVADSLEIAKTLSGEGNEVIEATGSEPWINWTRSGSTWTKPEIVIPAAPAE